MLGLGYFYLLWIVINFQLVDSDFYIGPSEVATINRVLFFNFTSFCRCHYFYRRGPIVMKFLMLIINY